ncbi:hypothetical protein RRG08_019967 [Elysia crispata]|uniref:Uncharacterized protein n=1 Tax=Elysia crispata TaxID=231223 RepID=A0AAE0YVK8_9GAST|nr:hypothetical protein RRG08_019967 [Elysia crispata]
MRAKAGFQDICKVREVLETMGCSWHCLLTAILFLPPESLICILPSDVSRAWLHIIINPFYRYPISSPLPLTQTFVDDMVLTPLSRSQQFPFCFFRAVEGKFLVTGRMSITYVTAKVQDKRFEAKSLLLICQHGSLDFRTEQFQPTSAQLADFSDVNFSTGGPLGLDILGFLKVPQCGDGRRGEERKYVKEKSRETFIASSGQVDMATSEE